MEHCVFVHTNHKQIVGALVAEYALRRNSRNNDQFDVRIIHHRDYPFFRLREGQLYLRDGVKRPWLNEDLQSFTCPWRIRTYAAIGSRGGTDWLESERTGLSVRIGVRHPQGYFSCGRREHGQISIGMPHT